MVSSLTFTTVCLVCVQNHKIIQEDRWKIRKARTVKEQHDANRAFDSSSQGIEADGHQIINLIRHK